MDIQTGRATKLSVIIPTRERSDTLHSSLKTCVVQDYDNLEIIVSDNCSTDNTREIVESFDDPRIRYINTGKRLGMSGNWEFALSHVTGGYLTFMGDDDGLLPDAISTVNAIIQDTGCLAVNSKCAEYRWPSNDGNWGSRLAIPLQHGLERRNSRETLLQVMRYQRSYLELPWLYRGFASHEVVKRAMEADGRFFHSMSPDFYSAVALSCVTDSYYFSSRPFALNGWSQHSTGGAHFSTGGSAGPKQQFLSEDNLPVHDGLSLAPTVALFLAESILQAKECIDAACDLPLDLKAVLTESVREAKYRNPVVYGEIIEGVRETASRHGLQEFAQNLISQSENHPRTLPTPIYGRDLVRKVTVLDGAAYGVQDVFAASQLCQQVLSGQHPREVSLWGGGRNFVKMCHWVLTGRYPRDVVWRSVMHRLESGMRKAL